MHASTDPAAADGSDAGGWCWARTPARGWAARGPRRSYRARCGPPRRSARPCSRTQGSRHLLKNPHVVAVNSDGGFWNRQRQRQQPSAAVKDRPPQPISPPRPSCRSPVSTTDRCDVGQPGQLYVIDSGNNRVLRLAKALRHGDHARRLSTSIGTSLRRSRPPWHPDRFAHLSVRSSRRRFGCERAIVQGHGFNRPDFVCVSVGAKAERAPRRWQPWLPYITPNRTLSRHGQN